ncbi:MAG: hypothetical protein Q4G19_02950 [Clostridia bacterium]|nr:hypothetical protein [Clostridia bacterium]
MFPKQISSTPKKASLGIYLRNRLQVASGVEITYEDLEKYGRTAIQATLIDNGLYYFDFSKPDKTPSKTVAMKSTTPPPVIHVSDKVKHKTYGIGIVESLSDNYIYVNFNGTIKPFQFPKSFETGFLSTFEDGQ